MRVSTGTTPRLHDAIIRQPADPRSARHGVGPMATRDRRSRNLGRKRHRLRPMAMWEGPDIAIGRNLWRTRPSRIAIGPILWRFSQENLCWQNRRFVCLPLGRVPKVGVTAVPSRNRRFGSLPFCTGEVVCASAAWVRPGGTGQAGLGAQAAHGVEDGQDRNPHISEDGQPHGGDADPGQSKNHDDGLYA